MDSPNPPPNLSENHAKRTSNIHHTPNGTPYLPLPLKHLSLTQPISITPLYKSDANTLVTNLSIPSIAQTLISVPIPYTISAAEYWINLQHSGTSQLELQSLRVGDVETGLLIGSCSLMRFRIEGKVKNPALPDPEGVEEGECELGYYIHPDWSGKGIITTAVRELVAWGKAEHNVKVIIRIEESNLSSQKVVSKFPQFVRDESRDSYVDWPEIKGGGRKKLLFWKWIE